MKSKGYLLIILGVFGLFNIACGDKDDDGSANANAPQLTIEDISISEGNENQTISLKVSLSAASTEVVTMNYNTFNGSATSGDDYEIITSGNLNFAASETEKFIEITIIGDETFEVDETFGLQLTNVVNANSSKVRATITILNDDDGNPFVIPSTGFTSPMSYPGMTLVWNDEFEGNSLDLSSWQFEIGTGSNGWGNNELQYYRSENTSFVDGHLVITAQPEVFGGQDYTSSRIKTENKKEFQYGRIDVRAVLPRTQGIWPAAWMLGDDIASVGWPKCGEIDIVELIGGGDNDKKIYGTAHWDNNNNYASFGGNYTLNEGIFADEFHVFSIIWTATSIKWYVDDIFYHEIDISPAGLSEFRHKFFFLFNVAVGGNWPGSPDATTVFPQRLIVDYIRLFQEE